MKRCLAMPTAIAAAMVALFLSLAPASAQSDRTWVSHTGNNDNNCSFSAPCKTFSQASARTSLHGEIDCLDAGDFGTITIARSVTIDCHSLLVGSQLILRMITVSLFSSPVQQILARK
jgi:hypothetical protein